VVAQDISGFLVPPFDAKRFSEAIERLLLDAVLRRQMGEAAARYVRERHDLRQNYRLVEDVLLGLVKKNDVDDRRPG
jgi:glycosyltransferase involved in cell wall biosynthesis